MVYSAATAAADPAAAAANRNKTKNETFSENAGAQNSRQSLVISFSQCNTIFNKECGKVQLF